MRNILIIPILFLLVACHKDNDTQQSNDKRLKQIITVAYSDNGGYYTEGVVFSTNYRWEGGVLVCDSQTSSYIEPVSDDQTLQYNGDTITYGTIIAIRRNGKIVEVFNTDPNAMNYHCTYTYDDYGQIEKEIVTYENNIYTTTTYTWSNGNVTRTHTEYDLQDAENNYDTYYSYDNKENPFKGSLIPTVRSISRNNLLERVQMTDYDTTRIIYNYSYKGNYPIIEYSQTLTSNTYNPIIPSKSYFVYMDGTSANIPQICNITATANRSTEAGYYARGGGQYEYGATVILQAFERDFIRWDDGNTDNPRTVIARGDATYTAIYTDK